MNPKTQTTLFFIASALAFLAVVITYVRSGDVNLSLVGAALFLAAAGEYSRRRTRLS